MDSEFIVEMEENLLAVREQIMKKFMSEDEDFRKLFNTMDIKDLGDVAADDVMARKMEALNQHDSNRLKLIESALTRLKNGKYGVCLKCGKKIPEDRLRAIPYALLCIQCKSGEEGHNHKRHV